MRKTTQSITGTSFHRHTFQASVEDIIAILGEPTCKDNTGEDKTNFEWIAETESGKVFTIYDWKEYRSISQTEEISWHIGGHSAMDTIEALQEIEKALHSLVK